MMQRRRPIRRWVDLIFNGQRSPLTYVVFSVFLAVPGNSFSSAVGEWVGNSVLATLVGFCLVAVAAWLVWRFTVWRERQVAVGITVSGDLAEPRRGLIVLVSPMRPDDTIDEIPATAAIRHHLRGEHHDRPESTLEYLWLICSADPPEQPSPTSSTANARELKRRYESALRNVEILEVRDYDDPEAVFLTAQEAYRQARKATLSHTEIVADITGGTKSMSIGLGFAAAGIPRGLQFMKPCSYDARGRAVAAAGSDALLLDVSFLSAAESD